MALDGDGARIARARRWAAEFLAALQSVHGLPVSQRALEVTQLVVSELVTNSYKYAPGPALLDLRVVGGLIEVAVWDTGPVLPLASAPDAGRVGRHGLEIVMNLAQVFEARREPVGKRITVGIALTDDPGGAPAGRDPL
jgi:anti-sigma regulatory factor (Ser/Thr protein kinase)